MQQPWPAGLKKTKQRRAVWDALSAAEKPLSAQELHSRLPGRDGFAVSTVYRALAALEEHGVVTRTTMLGEETAIYHLKQAGHGHFAICLGCHRQVPIGHCPLERATVETGDFQVTDHRLELYGWCAACREKEKGHG